MTNAAIQALDEYPNKRIIVHYMQPHYPFIGSEITFSGWYPDEIMGDRSHTDVHTPWDALKEGLVDRTKILNAYNNNLQLVMESVYELIEKIDGRIVVTANHGNAAGERTWPFPLQMYVHPDNLRMSALTTVPWAVIESGERRRILEKTTNSVAKPDEENITNRLQALGYSD